MSAARPKSVARLVLLVVVLLIAGGVLVYMQNRPPSLADIEQSISAGDLWGQSRDAADELFQVEPTRVPNSERESASTEQWLYRVRSHPDAYYLVRVQNGAISHAQRATSEGESLRPEEMSQ